MCSLPLRGKGKRFKNSDGAIGMSVGLAETLHIERAGVPKTVKFNVSILDTASYFLTAFLLWFLEKYSPSSARNNLDKYNEPMNLYEYLKLKNPFGLQQPHLHLREEIYHKIYQDNSSHLPIGSCRSYPCNFYCESRKLI
ncbi:unnamed protein product [Lepeophtheirus salmonis]|uniref:(salmon louse) hypothetical protein n=1 Tax=Lepeophtheirus salmonis TaxID=72036 RepID=A0A817FE90_LEPSM|nr:unnamed protein product [Lepeophtheirus salmonis]CAG9477545.1 unnamed protein product [Lepeophtheirus salmonis]